MPTTPNDALNAAARFVAQDRPNFRIVGLREDETDYLADVEPIDSNFEYPAGGYGHIFVSKETGMVWDRPYVYVIVKVEQMRAVIRG